MYIFGGFGNYGILKDLWSFNLYLHFWELQETFIGFHPIAFFSYTSFEYNSNFYFCIYGGFDYSYTMKNDLWM